MRVSEPAPEADANEILFPPTSAREIAVPVTLVPPPEIDCVPAAPPAAPTIVMLEIPVLRVMLAPAAKTIVPVEVAPAVPIARTSLGKAGTEIVIDPAPIPTEAIPAPEILRRFEKVPLELTVVFPRAVKEIEEV